MNMNNEQKLQVKVTAVTIMYGDRWKFLSQVVEAVMRDPYITTFVIVDNGSKNKLEIEEGVKVYGNRVVVLRQEKNLGSAGGFAKGLEYARTTDSDFVFLLDDDSVPEDNTIEQLLYLRKLFKNEKVVLSASRPSVPGNIDYFYKPSLETTLARRTFFEVFSFSKFENFIRLLIKPKINTVNSRPFIPIIPNESFVYGGAFIPMEAVRQAPLPDSTLFLYGDDIEYSWGIKEIGYDSYVCSRPCLIDVDLTFGGAPILGLFDPETKLLFKIYYRIRNMVRISVKHSRQLKLVLFINIIVWVFGLFLIGLFKYGVSRTYFKRVKLILQAVYGGYVTHYKTPSEASLPL